MICCRQATSEDERRSADLIRNVLHGRQRSIELCHHLDKIILGDTVTMRIKTDRVGSGGHEDGSGEAGAGGDDTGAGGLLAWEWCGGSWSGVQ